ncbi:MAG: mechanosensitive ion channel family protein [Planctomycetota bacterium]
MVPGRRVLILLLCAAAMLLAPRTSGAQDDRSPTSWTSAGILQTPLEDLEIRLVPLSLSELEPVRAAVMAEVRASSEALADAMIERNLLTRASPDDKRGTEELAERIIGLLLRKQAVMARARLIVDAIEAKGGDAASDRAYLEAVMGLRPDLAETFLGGAETRAESAETALRRADELVRIVGADPPAHERELPWEVPVAELRLELQPLSTGEILARLDRWRAILQEQVRQRIRIDILLNNTRKLERSIRVRDEGARLVGLPPEEVSNDEIKSALAQRAEQQQQIVSAIVDRMRVGIELCRARGNDAQEYVDYIASATGRRLNFSDVSVLRVQVTQWLISPSGGLKVARKIAVFVGVAALFWVFSKLAGWVTRLAVRRVPRASTLLGPVLAGIVQKVLLVIGFVIAASAVGVDTGPLLAMIGAAGLVIGLALQGTLSNFASGILILLNRPFDVGDVVDAGGVFGKVEAMNLVSTTILTFDNQLMLVPNNQIWNAVITNVTGKRTRRIDLTFGIAYSADIAKAVAALEELLGSHPKTLADPAPVVRVHELADSSVNLIARPWVHTDDYWDVYWDLTRQVKERFDADGIGIPFPQRDLHVPGSIEVKLAPTGRGQPDRAPAPTTTHVAPEAEPSETHEAGPSSDSAE